MEWPIAVDDELRDRVHSRVRAQRAHVTLIDGPAGIGKSTLASSVARRMVDEGYQLLPVTGMPELRDIPLGALAPLLANPDAPDTEPAADRLHRFFSIASRGSQNHLLVVDDGPQLDEISASAVYQLVQTYGMRCLMTARTPSTLTGPLLRLDDEGAIERVHLGGLDDVVMARLVETALGARVETESLTALLSLAAGNPLFLRGLVVAAARSGATHPSEAGLVIDTSALPSRLRDSIAARFERLTSSERELAELVATAARWPDGLLGQSSVIRSLESQGILERAGEDVVLAHPLFGEYLLLELDAELRHERRLEASRLLATAGHDVHRFTAVCLLADTPTPPDAADLAWAARYAHDVDDHTLTVHLATLSIELDNDPGSAIHLLRADSLSHLGALDDADAEFTTAERLARDDDARAAVSTRRGFHLAMRRQHPLAAIEQGQRTLEQMPFGRARSFLRANVAKWQLMVGEAPDPEELQDTGAGDATSEVNAAVFHISAAVFAGDLPAMRAGLATLRGLAAVARPVIKHGTQFADFAEFWVTLLDGQITEAVSFARDHRTDADVSTIGMWDFALALATSLTGPTSEAVAHAESAARELAVVDFIGARTAAIALHATGLARAGESDAARALLAELPTDSSYVAAEVQAAQAEAWMLHLEGRDEEAVDKLVRSATLALDTRYTTFAAFACLSATRFGGAAVVLPIIRTVLERAPGTTLAAIGAHVEAMASGEATTILGGAHGLARVGLATIAGEAARHAADLAGAHGDQRLARRARVLASSFDPEPRAPGRSTDSFALTSREWDVALAAAGRARNREIAEHLGLSHRTVENHLANIFRKLGVTGRDELRDELRELGALEGGPLGGIRD